MGRQYCDLSHNLFYIMCFTKDIYVVLYSQYTNQMKSKKNVTLSEKIHIYEISKSGKETKSIPLTNKYMIPHFPGMVQALQ